MHCEHCLSPVFSPWWHLSHTMDTSTVMYPSWVNLHALPTRLMRTWKIPPSQFRIPTYHKQPPASQAIHCVKPRLQFPSVCWVTNRIIDSLALVSPSHVTTTVEVSRPTWLKRKLGSHYCKKIQNPPEEDCSLKYVDTFAIYLSSIYVLQGLTYLVAANTWSI